MLQPVVTHLYPLVVLVYRTGGQDVLGSFTAAATLEQYEGVGEDIKHAERTVAILASPLHTADDKLLVLPAVTVFKRYILQHVLHLVFSVRL